MLLEQDDGGISPRIYNVGTRKAWEVSFTLRPLYVHEYGLQYVLKGKMVGFHAWIGRFAAQKTPITYLEPNPDSTYIQLVAYSLQRLSYPRSYKTKNNFTVQL